MERSDFASLLFFYEIFLRGYFSHKKKRKAPTLRVNKFKKEWIIIKEITKEGIQKLIKARFIKSTGKGYINPKRHQPVSIVKTVHGRHYYTEDFYADMATKLR